MTGPGLPEMEREACAAICEELPLEIDERKWSKLEDQYLIRVAEAGCRNAFAAAIRARSGSPMIPGTIIKPGPEGKYDEVVQPLFLVRTWSGSYVGLMLWRRVLVGWLRQWCRA